MKARGLSRIFIPGAVLLLILFDSTVRVSGEEPRRLGKVEREEIRLVLIDAVVTDERGRPVPGLSQADFRLRVDGRDAPVAAFEDRCAAPALQATPGKGPGSGPPSVPPGGASAADSPSPSSPGVAARVQGEPIRLVLYFDLPHLSGAGAARSVRAARKFLENGLAGGAGVAGGARMMVVSFGPEVRILSPFTEDRGALLSALDRVTSPGATYDEGPLARERKIEAVSNETCPEMVALPQCANQLALAREFAREEESAARRSLDALRATLSALNGVRGRKGLVLFTETLRDEPGVQYLEMAKSTPRSQQILTRAINR